jgi:hypothetical protein
MHRPEIFAQPYVEAGNGFRMQAVTYWLKAIPARTMMGMRAGSVDVELPSLPKGASALGFHTRIDGYDMSCDSVSSVWLAQNPKALDDYLASLRKSLGKRGVKLDERTRQTILNGAVDIFVSHDGDKDFDRIDVKLHTSEDYQACLALLHKTPTGSREPLAFPPKIGQSRLDPSFMLGTQSWLDGHRLLIEYIAKDTGATDTVALDRDSFTASLERAFSAMATLSEKIVAAIGHALNIA